ncbi:TolC family protein [Mucilaginibacter sp. HMF7410]|uniref:TolC family protein n=2 Tax=Mucilaginibacter arboris TaxID=2682090 RepID=A0A7K1SXF4_9SPHI|nr:TolC family protein [Mucilaginibacter arboris]
MFHRTVFRPGLCLMFLLSTFHAVFAQQKILTLKEAVQTTLQNYGTIKAKANYAQASAANLKETKREYLPNLNVSGQNDFGTVNSQYGPSYGLGGFGVSSSGPILSGQNWNAAFGGLYLANLNWDFFSFGKSKEKIKVAQSQLTLDQSDVVQEQFQQEVRVSSAYLNLLASQQLTRSQQNNLQRAIALRNVVVARAKSGLNPGVDSSLANAEVASAQIALVNAQDVVQQQGNQLSQYLVATPADLVLDSVFVSKLPKSLDTAINTNLSNHPVLQYFQNRVNISTEREKYLRTFNYPTFSLFNIFQSKGSGFNTYTLNQVQYTQDYFSGVNPTRSNYLLGIGVSWNLTSPLRVHEQVKAQQFTSEGLRNEYLVTSQQLTDQLILSKTRIQNALKNYQQAPIGLKAASDAYLQKTVLYRNGLATIVDVTQALYALNRAETDRDIANNNVWQALLYKAAASGDFSLFINEF